MLVKFNTSWMLGVSRSSANTNTPGAEVASWISLAAAAPFADLDINKKVSSFEVKLAPRSMLPGCRIRSQVQRDLVCFVAGVKRSAIVKRLYQAVARTARLFVPVVP